MGKFSGRIALVTAATEGIGYAIARSLAQEGAHVVICSRKQVKVDEALQQLQREGLSVSGMPCHVGKAADRSALLNKIKAEQGGIDMLICNAGMNPYFGSMLATPESAFDKIFDINVKSTFMLIQEAMPLIEGRRKASIVIVSSLGGYVSNNLLGVYSVSKTALLGLTKALSGELASKGIRINCIAPGLIKTKFSNALFGPDDGKELIKTIPLGRVGIPEDCSGSVVFLCSDDASYITGETIVMSGGLKSRL